MKDLAKNLKIESVSRLQPPAPLRLSPQETVRQAVAQMQEERRGCVLVCDGEQLLGIFSERDLLNRVLGPNKPLTLRLQDCMTANPATIQLKDTVANAIRLMQEGGYRNLPVVDGNGKPVGVLSVKGIVRYLAEHFPVTVYNQPPDPDAVQHAREGA